MRTADRYLAVLTAALLAAVVILAEATDTVRAAWPWIGFAICASALLLAGVALIVGIAGAAWRKYGRRTVPAERMRAKHVTPARYAHRPTRLDTERAAASAHGVEGAQQPVEPTPAEWAMLLAAAAVAEAEMQAV